MDKEQVHYDEGVLDYPIYKEYLAVGASDKSYGVGLVKTYIEKLK